MHSDTLRYLGSRLVTTALIIFGAMVLLFTLSNLVPVDRAAILVRQPDGASASLH